MTGEASCQLLSVPEFRTTPMTSLVGASWYGIRDPVVVPKTDAVMRALGRTESDSGPVIAIGQIFGPFTVPLKRRSMHSSERAPTRESEELT